LAWFGCVDEMKSRADWQRETSLLRELVDTVTQRSSIVQSMETDRLRYPLKSCLQ